MADIETEADIKTFVDAFYEKVLADPLLRPIFVDIAKLDVEKHMPIMYSFWGTMLLGIGDYKGSPMSPHFKFRQYLHLAHFQRWISLFEETIDSKFRGLMAEMAKQRARNIAGVFQIKMEIN